MKVTPENTKTIVKNLRAEGQHSRADYLEFMQDKIDFLWSQLLLTEQHLGELIGENNHVL